MPAKSHGHAARKRRGRSKKTRVTREYQTWQAMSGKWNKASVVDHWRGKEGFVNFLKDMGDKPLPQRSYRLARRNKKAAFGPDNCFWEKWRAPTAKLYEYQGEKYTLPDLAWIHGMGESVLRYRFQQGMSVHDAVTIPLTKTRKYISAFGESKTMRAWTRDPRCKVTYHTLLNRMTKKWNPEAALTIPYKRVKLFEAFGDKKSIADWSRDPRCVFSNDDRSDQQRFCLIWFRLKKGISMQEALTTPARILRKKVFTNEVNLV